MRFSRGNFFIAYWIVYLLFMGFYMYLSKREEYKNSEKATAVVIDRIETIGRRRGIYFYPQFQFTYNDSVYISADKLY